LVQLGHIGEQELNQLHSQYLHFTAPQQDLKEIEEAEREAEAYSEVV
jgi:hypothetical protein